MKIGLGLAIVLAAGSLPCATLAQEKSASRPGFVLPPASARIVLMRPTIRVGEQSTGGLFEPNADWSTQAREHIGLALRKAQASLGNEVIEYDEPAGGDRGFATQYGHLFSSLAGSVQEYQLFTGNRLPTKKRKGQFEWSLGAGVAQLPALQNADYALFIWTQDAYGSAGRKLLQAVGFLGAIVGAPMMVSSGVHRGYAGLIEIKTGDLVWINADHAMGGDVRTPEGAAKRVAQLLDNFPGAPNAKSAPARVVR